MLDVRPSMSLTPKIVGLLALASTLSLSGQVIEVPQPIPVGPQTVITFIKLRPITLAYTPAPPPARVTVIPGSAVVLSTGLDDSAIQTIAWYKDQVVVGTSHTLEIPQANARSSGRYWAIVNADTTSRAPTEQLTLRVEEYRGLRALNLSTRANISPTQPFFISGIVVSPSGTSGSTEQKTFLLRAVGPTLAQYGVPNPLADPVLTVYAADGSVVSPAAMVAVIPSPLETTTQRVGAFPLISGSKDVAALYILPPGVFSAKVASASGGTGTVLFEAYDVSD
jgi:hypothetical protein